MKPIQIAISTCPNDTFAFHGLISGAVKCAVPFEIELLDISELNAGLFAGRFDVAKASFHAALLLANETWVLPSGSALGFGVGPLLLAAQENTKPKDSSSLTLCPGQYTTAMLLFRMFYGTEPRVEQVVFSDIMPQLKDGSADFGVCIHEGRFTWQDEGLYLVEDLGTRWEAETESPLPLGGILARRSLDFATIGAVQDAIHRSIVYGQNHRHETLQSMRMFAQEFEDDVLFKHVDLYVNDWTLELGEAGRSSLQSLSTIAAERMGVAAIGNKLEVWPAQA